MRILLPKAERDYFVQVKDDVSHEEVVAYYTLSSQERIFVKNKRGANNQLGFAIQIGVIKHKGYNLSSIEYISKNVINYVALQLEIESSHYSEYSNRRNTLFEHQKEINEIFLYRYFQKDADSVRVNEFLLPLVYKTNDPYHLISKFIEFCKINKLIPPGISTIDEHIAILLNKIEDEVILNISDELSESQKTSIENLLSPNDTDNSKINLTELRATTGKCSPSKIAEMIEKLEILSTLNIIISTKIPNYIYQNYILLGERYEPIAFRRFSASKRYAILSVFLMNLTSELTDYVIDMHDMRFQNVFSKIEKNQDKIKQEKAKLNKLALNEYVNIGQLIQNNKVFLGNKVSINFSFSLSEWNKFQENHRKAVELSVLYNRSSLESLEQYYGSFRKYLPLYLKVLDFKTDNTTYSNLLDNIAILKEMNLSGKRILPDDYKIESITKKWDSIIEKSEDVEKRHFFEIATINELRLKMRTGDIYVENSKKYRSISEYIISKEQWDNEKINTRLSVPLDVEEYLKSREEKLETLMKYFNKNSDILENILNENNKLKPKRVEYTTPEAAEKLSHELYSLIPKISLQDLLLEVAKMTNFHKHFKNFVTQSPIETKEELTTLIFSIMAVGINAGISSFANCVPGITYKQLQHTVEWNLLEENLQNAIIEMVEYQLQEPIAKWWGDGSTTSSDGMRVQTAVDSINASYNPHFGFEKGVTFYRFLNDQYTSFYSTVTNTNARDALHVIDGILKYTEKIKIDEHYTDTGGYTDHIFALSPIVGFKFSPRLRSLPDLRLFAFDRNKYPKLSKLFSGNVEKKLIRNNYDSILRVGHSIYEEEFSSSIILGKLSSFSKNNEVSKALKEIGKIEKTLFILEYAINPELRKRIQVGLNKGEAMNSMARDIFFGKKGQLWEHTFQKQLQKSSCLNVIINAIVLWNTKYLSKAWNYYKNEHPETDEKLLKHVSPLNWENITFLGKYYFEVESKFEEDNLRKLEI